MEHNSRLLTLDAMRGFAALLVVLYHLSDVAFRVAPGGYLAVDFFFALSGFVISQAYSHKLNKTLSTSQFFRARVIRLYPLFAIGLAFAVAKAVGQTIAGDENVLSFRQLGSSFFLEIFMIPSPFGGEDLFPLNGPVWSLFFELVINLAFALWLVRMSSTALWVIAGIAGAFVATAAFAYNTLNLGWSWETSWAGLARVTFSFAAGVLISRAKLSPRFRGASFIVPILLLGALMILPVEKSWRAGFDSATALLIAPILLVTGILVQPPPRMAKYCEFLGDMSYPLYAIHFPLLFIMGFVARKAGIEPVVWVPMFMVWLTLFSWLLGRFIDPPARALLTSLTKRMAKS